MNLRELGQRVLQQHPNEERRDCVEQHMIPAIMGDMDMIKESVRTAAFQTLRDLDSKERARTWEDSLPAERVRAPHVPNFTFEQVAQAEEDLSEVTSVNFAFRLSNGQSILDAEKEMVDADLTRLKMEVQQKVYDVAFLEMVSVRLLPGQKVKDVFSVDELIRLLRKARKTRVTIG